MLYLNDYLVSTTYEQQDLSSLSTFRGGAGRNICIAEQVEIRPAYSFLKKNEMKSRKILFGKGNSFIYGE